MRRATLTLLLFLTAPPLTVAGQEIRRLTAEDAAAIAGFYNRPETTRLVGEARIARGATVTGGLAVLGGPVRLAGTVEGDVVVINGDLLLAPDARVVGAATVVGGRVAGDAASVEGPVVVFPEALRFRQEGGRLLALPPDDGSWLGAPQPIGFGTVELNLAVDGSYNRVEGLPVRAGPRLTLGRSNPTVLDAQIIYRTQSGLRVHPDELGYDVGLEQYLGGHRSLRLGIVRHRVVDPIETRGLGDNENSLSTFVLHRDYRDHYHRRGWRLYLAYAGRARPLDLALEYRDEAHGSLPPRTPWSLLDNDAPWRPQPLVAEGDLQTLLGRLRWDSRNEPSDPSAGWLVNVELEQGLEGDLAILERGAAPELVQQRDVESEFTRALIDVRRYLRLGPRTRLSLRAMAEGSADDGALPPQRQHVLGGEGSLPGYQRLGLDCGARDGPLVDGFFPYYGCDRVLLFQAELRYAVLGGGRLSLGRQLGLDFDLITTPELVLFADAGRAWIEEESLDGRGSLGTGSLRADAGIGIRVGRVGFYLATPLTEGGDGVNFFVRLGPRL